MSNDVQCVGICMIDPDSGVCLGCGRLPEEIAGVPVPTPVELAPEPEYKLPPNVQAEVGQGSD